MVSGSFKKILGGVLLWTALSFSALLVDKVVASVNSEPILESDVKMGMLFYSITSREKVIERLVEDMLIYQFLLGKGLQVSQEVIDQSLQNIAMANNLTLEGFAKELAKENLTLEDLRRFLEREIVTTSGLQVYLEREVSISERELELEGLRRGEAKRVRDIELLVVDKKDEKKLQKVFDPKKNLEDMAKALETSVERLRVSKGELVEVLDKEVWQAPVGRIAIAEDKDYIYIAKVLSEGEVFQGKSIEELKEELLLKKMKQKKEELLARLRRNSYIKILQ
ncbi:MAG: peptidylprolyl isomerase [Aquificaceae bacterium]